MGTAVAIVFLIVILAALLYPLWRPPLLALGKALGPASEMAALQERKLAIYGAIREAGFDLRTDKMSEADYQTEVEKLKGEAVEVIGQIEALGSRPPRGPDQLERVIARARAEIGAPEAPAAPAGKAPAPSTGKAPAGPTSTETGPVLFCTQCGRPAGAQDHFCAGCGAKLHVTA